MKKIESRRVFHRECQRDPPPVVGRTSNMFPWAVLYARAAARSLDGHEYGESDVGFKWYKVQRIRIDVLHEFTQHCRDGVAIYAVSMRSGSANTP